MWPWQRQQRYTQGRSGSKPKPALFLGVTLLVSVGAGAFHNSWQAKGKTDPITATIHLAVYPFQMASSKTQGFLQGVWDGMFAGPRMAQENALLKAENARLVNENNELRAQVSEAGRLQEALKFQQTTKKPLLAAHVIGLLPSPHFETIVLDRGGKDGVKERSIVRTPVGLVGQVTEAGPVSSQVLLLSDAKSRVHGTVWRKGKPLGYYGVVKGTGRGEPLRMIDLKHEYDIQPGDTVLSSGFGGVFPPDVPIGVVESVTEDTSTFLKTAKITPAAPQPGDLREAFILP